MRVEGLTRELVRVINTGTTAQREQLRELAIDLLREQESIIPELVEPEEPETAVRADGFNPFGLAILLVLMGGVLIILFPLVGFVMFVGAALMMVWGVIMALFSRR